MTQDILTALNFKGMSHMTLCIPSSLQANKVASHLSSMEQRHYLRWPLFLFLDVLERSSKQLLGHLSDVSVDGMMFITAQPLSTNQIKDVYIQVESLDEIPDKLIEVQVQTRWVKPNLNPKWYCVGCHFLRVNPNDLILIDKLGKTLSFDNDSTVYRVDNG